MGALEETKVRERSGTVLQEIHNLAAEMGRSTTCSAAGNPTRATWRLKQCVGASLEKKSAPRKRRNPWEE